MGVVLRIVRDNALAEDIVHDAFLKIWTGAASFDAERGSARGWIFSVTRHLALNRLRATSRERPAEEAGEDLAQATLEGWQETADAFDWRIDPDRLHGCLEQLEPVRRNCVFHAYVEGYTHQEIARQVGAPLGTVKAWIKRSLKNLRECMG